MKITSAFSDYYDRFAEEYASPKLEYVRTTRDPSGFKRSHVPHFLRPRPFFNKRKEADAHWEDTHKPHLIVLAVCGRIYCVAEEKGKLIHGPGRWENASAAERGLEMFPKALRAKATMHLRSTRLNEIHQCPIILVHEYPNGPASGNILDPRLEDYQFDKVVGAHDMLLMLEGFLKRPEPTAEPIVKNKLLMLAQELELRTS